MDLIQIQTDEYGRELQGLYGRYSNRRQRFRASISDNPFGVNIVDFETPTHRLPDQAILQFFTFTARLFVYMNTKATEASDPGDGLVRCDLADKNKDWCGHIVLNRDWAEAEDGKEFNFIALSQAKSFTKTECADWAYYIPRDLDDVEWYLYFVLLITWNQDRLVWERVGLGKVVHTAFELGGLSWKEILLG